MKILHGEIGFICLNYVPSQPKPENLCHEHLNCMCFSVTCFAVESALPIWWVNRHLSVNTAFINPWIIKLKIPLKNVAVI